MTSVSAASANGANSAPPVAPERRVPYQEPSGSVAKPPPSLDQQHLAAVDRKVQTQSETQQASRDAGVPQVYGEVDPTRRGQVFSLRV